MSVLDRLASSLGRCGEVPNRELARELAVAASDEYNETIFPYLLKHLAGCRPKEVPQHAERTLPGVNSSNKADFINLLEKRIEDLSGTGLARVKKS